MICTTRKKLFQTLRHITGPITGKCIAPKTMYLSLLLLLHTYNYQSLILYRYHKKRSQHTLFWNYLFNLSFLSLNLF